MIEVGVGIGVVVVVGFVDRRSYIVTVVLIIRCNCVRCSTDVCFCDQSHCYR